MWGWIGLCSSPFCRMFTSINKSVQISTVPFLPALSQKIVVNFAEVPYAAKLGRWYSVLHLLLTRWFIKGECGKVILLNRSLPARGQEEPRNLQKNCMSFLNLIVSALRQLVKSLCFHQRYRTVLPPGPTTPRVKYKQFLFSLLGEANAPNVSFLILRR